MGAVFIFLAIGVVIFVFIEYEKTQKENKEKAERDFAETKARYEAALSELEHNPRDPKARVKCLEIGRIYYLWIIPDTHTVWDNGSTSDYQNNSAGREARINSDIEARTGHLKVA